jgi:hypothetical protein
MHSDSNHALLAKTVAIYCPVLRPITNPLPLKKREESGEYE